MKRYSISLAALIYLGITLVALAALIVGIAFSIHNYWLLLIVFIGLPCILPSLCRIPVVTIEGPHISIRSLILRKPLVENTTQIVKARLSRTIDMKARANYGVTIYTAKNKIHVPAMSPQDAAELVGKINGIVAQQAGPGYPPQGVGSPDP